MAFSGASQKTFAESKTRSQSDSDLLNPGGNSNGIYPGSGIKRNTSMDDLEARSKKKNFLYKLVRPWKWRHKRKSSKNKSPGKLMQYFVKWIETGVW